MSKTLVKKTSGKLAATRALHPKNIKSGVVSSYLYESSRKTSVSALGPEKIISALKAGLPIKELDDLRVSLDIPMEKLAPRLGMSSATLHRRRLVGKLEPLESDRVVRFARLMGKSIEVLESKLAARLWLSSPQVGLGGAIPLDYAETEVGAREVEDLLGRIEFGVYS